jgi:hypothetical protein
MTVQIHYTHMLWHLKLPPLAMAPPREPVVDDGQDDGDDDRDDPPFDDDDEDELPPDGSGEPTEVEQPQP